MDKTARDRLGESVAAGVVGSIIATIIVGTTVAIISHLDSTWTSPIVSGILAALLTFGACIGIMIYRVIPKIHRPTTLDNVENRIKEWLDNFGLSVKRDPVLEAHFRYIVNTDSDLRIIMGRLKNDFSPYIMLRVEVGPKDDEQKSAIASLSEEEKNSVMTQIKLELNRAKIGYGGLGTAGFTSLNGLVLTKRIPISSSLTEDSLLVAIEEIEAAYHLVLLTASSLIDQKVKSHPKSLEVSS